MTHPTATALEDIPEGVDLNSLHEAVQDDLVDGRGLADLLGSRHVDGSMVSKTSVPRIRPILVALTARAAGASTVDKDTQYLSEILHLALAFHDFTLGREGGRRRRMARRLARSMTWMGSHHLTLRAMEIGRSVQPELLDDLPLRLLPDRIGRRPFQLGRGRKGVRELGCSNRLKLLALS